jgi:hypothetical protein
MSANGECNFGLTRRTGEQREGRDEQQTAVRTALGVLTGSDDSGLLGRARQAGSLTQVPCEDYTLGNAKDASIGQAGGMSRSEIKLDKGGAQPATWAIGRIP